MKKKVRIILIILGSAVLLVAGLFLLRKLLASSSSAETFYRARVETYENVIEISGTVAAAQEQTLQALSAGTVTAVYVNAGDSVKKGDVIIQLDDSEQVYNLEKQEYSMATKRVTGSARELKLMETELLALIQKVNDRKVVATFDGIIADLDVAVGDSLEAKDEIGTLVNIDYLTAEVEVAETDVSKLAVGQKVEFTFPAYSSTTVYGTVTGWPAIGEVTSRGATIVNAKIRIDDYPEQILPNFSFTGKIQISPTEEYVVVERYAVGYEEHKAYVVIAKTGEKRNVTAVPYGSGYVKVLEGLSGGEVLRQVTAPRKSGQNQNRKGERERGREDGAPGGFGSPGGAGGGAGGAPGGFPGGGGPM